MFFPRCDFGTGNGLSDAGVGIRSTGWLSDRLFGVGRKTIFKCLASHAGPVYPLSAAGVFSRLCVDRHCAFAVEQFDLRFLSVLFRQLLCGIFRDRRDFPGNGCFGFALMHHDAVFPLDSSAVFGKSVHRPWPGQAVGQRKKAVAVFRGSACDLAVWCVSGSYDFAVSAGAGFTALFLIRKEREGLL